MDIRALRYSLDPHATTGLLRSGTIFDIDTTELQSRMDTHNVRALVDGETDFHYKLHTIQASPYIIYYMGDLSLLNHDILAIVGPRKKTFYSDRVISTLLQQSKYYDLVTISGMAPGVDQLAHRLSISHDIPTIAILGGGIRRYLDRYDRHIIYDIIDHGGLVISEFKLDFQATNYSFPQRNRIIAGLSDAVFLPQAGLQSGSLITVDFALKMSKPVYGVPDSIFSPESAGVNQYIADKKINLVSDFDKFLSSHFTRKSQGLYKKVDFPSLSPNEKSLISILADNPNIGLDALCSLSNIPSSQLFGLITMLEINNIIYQLSPGVYRLCV